MKTLEKLSNFYELGHPLQEFGWEIWEISQVARRGGDRVAGGEVYVSAWWLSPLTRVISQIPQPPLQRTHRSPTSCAPEYPVSGFVNRSRAGEPSHGAGAQSKGHSRATHHKPSPPTLSQIQLLSVSSGICYLLLLCSGKKGTLSGKALIVEFLELEENFRATVDSLYSAFWSRIKLAKPCQTQGHSQCSESSRQGQFHNLPANDNHCCLLNVWK